MDDLPPRQIDLLKTSRFLPLFITQFLGAFVDNLYKNALVVLILYGMADTLEGDPKLLTTLAAAVFIFPFLIFSAIAGKLADTHPKDSMMRQRSGTGILTRGSQALGAGTCAGSIGGNWYSRGAPCGLRKSIAASVLSAGFADTGDWAYAVKHIAKAANPKSPFISRRIRFARYWR